MQCSNLGGQEREGAISRAGPTNQQHLPLPPRCGSSCENSCKDTTYSFQSARTGADHQGVNTVVIGLRNILLVEPTLQVGLQAPLGDPTRGEEIMDKWPLHRPSQSGLARKSNMPRICQTHCVSLSSAQPLAAGLVSSATSMWLLSRLTEGLHICLLTGSGFLPTGSTAPGGRVASETQIFFPSSSTSSSCCHRPVQSYPMRVKLPLYRLLQLSHKRPPLLYLSCKTGSIF